MRRGGGVRGRRGVITLLKAHYQCDIGYHGSTGYHGSAGYHGNREVTPVTSVPGWKAIYSHLHNYTERLFCIALLIRSFDIIMAEM